MAKSHGSKAQFRLGTAAAPTVVGDMSQYANSVGLSLNRDASEVTTFAKQSKAYIPGLKDATVPFEGPYDDQADQVLWDLLNQGIIVNFEYYPAGIGVGVGPKYTGVCMITSHEISSGVGDPNSLSSQFQVSGDVLRTVQ